MGRELTGRGCRRACRWVALAAAMVMGHNAAHGAEIAKECLVSYDVKKDKGIELDRKSVSCVQLEHIRAGILETLIALEGESERQAIENQRIEALRTQAKSARNKARRDIAALVWHMTGNVAAMLALQRCTPTLAGLPCLVAVVKAIIKKVEVVYTTVKLGDSVKAAAALKEELERAAKGLSEDNAAQLGQAKDNVTNEFNALCETVRTQCVVR